MFNFELLGVQFADFAFAVLLVDIVFPYCLLMIFVGAWIKLLKLRGYSRRLDVYLKVKALKCLLYDKKRRGGVVYELHNVGSET